MADAYRVIGSGVTGEGTDNLWTWQLREDGETLRMVITYSDGFRRGGGSPLRRDLGASLMGHVFQEEQHRLAYGAISTHVQTVTAVVSVTGERSAAEIFNVAGERAYFVASSLSHPVEQVIVDTGTETAIWPSKLRAAEDPSRADRRERMVLIELCRPLLLGEKAPALTEELASYYGVTRPRIWQLLERSYVRFEIGDDDRGRDEHHQYDWREIRYEHLAREVVRRGLLTRDDLNDEP